MLFYSVTGMKLQFCNFRKEFYSFSTFKKIRGQSGDFRVISVIAAMPFGIV